MVVSGILAGANRAVHCMRVLCDRVSGCERDTTCALYVSIHDYWYVWRSKASAFGIANDEQPIEVKDDEERMTRS